MRIPHFLKKLLHYLFSFEEIKTITIMASLVDNICYMAAQAHPKEILIFLSASKGIVKGELRIDELQLQAYNASTESAHVWLSNIPMTTTIIGTVHSHPSANNHPSDADLHFFSKFGYIHAILAAPYTPRSLQFYSKEGKKISITTVQRL